MRRGRVTQLIYMFNIVVIFLAKYLLILPTLILGIYFLTQPRQIQKNILTFTIPSLLLTYLLGLLAGHLYYDPRPFVVGNFTPLIPHTPDNGFPSDHTLVVSAIAIIGSYLNWRLGVILWVLGLIVAAARVYIGLHHPIDVVGSLAIAVIATSAVFLFIKYVCHKEIS